MTWVSGSMFGTRTMVYDDEKGLTPVAYPSGGGSATDSCSYNALGQRMRGTVPGTTWRYVYFGDRVLEETNDFGGPPARHTVAGLSYYQPWLHMQRAGGLSRFPVADAVGSARRQADAGGTATDAYSLDAFGVLMYAWTNPTQNPYRFGAAWGYVTDAPSPELLQ